MSKLQSETSKFLSYVLRHEPQAIGLTLDREGWADIAALIAGAKQSSRALDEALIHAIVASSDKKRFAISEDGLRIRAVRGHSTSSVTIAYPEKVPPVFLYHGTATHFFGINHARRTQTRRTTVCASDRGCTGRYRCWPSLW